MRLVMGFTRTCLSPPPAAHPRLPFCAGPGVTSFNCIYPSLLSRIALYSIPLLFSSTASSTPTHLSNRCSTRFDSWQKQSVHSPIDLIRSSCTGQCKAVECMKSLSSEIKISIKNKSIWIRFEFVIGIFF